MIVVNVLNKRDFVPYGQIIESPVRKPDSSEPTHDYWDKLTVFTGETSLNYLSVKQRELGISLMERHCQSPELLVLLSGTCLLPVAAPGDFLPETIRVFALNPGDAVLLASGTWHWVPFPLQNKAEFIVVFRAATPTDDLEFVHFDPLRIEGGH